LIDAADGVDLLNSVTPVDIFPWRSMRAFPRKFTVHISGDTGVSTAISVNIGRRHDIDVPFSKAEL
jgi:hypothetical protein